MYLGSLDIISCDRGAVNAEKNRYLVWASDYNVFTIPLSAGAHYSWGVVFSLAVGAALMAASTVIVAINARLLRLKKLPGSC